MAKTSKISTRLMVLGALLTALSFIIPLTFPKLPLPQPFSVTIASHVPTILAMLINPIVAIFTVIGSTAAFLMSLGPIVSLRAASHIIFAMLGVFLLNKNFNLYLTLGICAIVHALSEVVAVYAFTPNVDMGFLWGTVFGITVFHHVVDCVITVPIYKALKRAKLI